MTQTFEQSTASDTDPIRALRQYPLIVVVFAVAFGILGAGFASSQPPTFVATAGLVVEDARTSGLFDSRAGDAERYVADQVAILRSAAVAERASALALTLEPPAEISASEFEANLALSSSVDTSFIEISFSADDPTTAQSGADAIGMSYQEVISAALAEDAQTAIARLDQAIDETVAEIGLIQAEVEAVRADNEDRVLLDDQLAEIVAELVELRNVAGGNPTGANDLATVGEIDRVTARAEQLSAELSARLLVSDVEARLPKTSVLLRQQQDAAALLSELTLQRSQIEVDSQLAGNGVAFFAPAGPGQRAGIASRSAVLVSVVLGGFVGSGVAYWLSQRRQRVEDRLTPRNILGVPLLVDIPGPRAGSALLARSRLQEPVSSVPVLEDPTSPQANAFRILAGALHRQLREWRVEPEPVDDEGAWSQHGMIVACLAAEARESNPPVALNLALAAGQTGLRVALVEADLVPRDLSRLVRRAYVRPSTAGLAEIIQGTATLEGSLGRIELGDGGEISVLGLGSGSNSPELFGSQAFGSIMWKLAEGHDLVVLSLPPVMEVPHAAAIQQADKALLVVQHGTGASHLEEARHRMDIMGVPMAGYAYINTPTRAPARPRRPVRPVTDGNGDLYDDFTRIKGIGPRIQDLLHDEGITTLEELAATTPARLRQILEAAGPGYAIHDPANWPHLASLSRYGPRRR